jgi:transcriptional regulator with XRE-family HTH domain
MNKTIWTKEYAEFIKKLRQARTDAGFKQIEVAKKLKRPQSYVSRVESGAYRLDIIEVKMFAKLYGKSINDLI